MRSLYVECAVGRPSLSSETTEISVTWTRASSAQDSCAESKDVSIIGGITHAIRVT